MNYKQAATLQRLSEWQQQAEARIAELEALVRELSEKRKPGRPRKTEEAGEGG